MGRHGLTKALAQLEIASLAGLLSSELGVQTLADMVHLETEDLADLAHHNVKAVQRRRLGRAIAFAKNAAAANAIAEAASASVGSSFAGATALDASGQEMLRLRQEGAALRLQAATRGYRSRKHALLVREVGHARAAARRIAQTRGDPYCRRLEGRSSYSKLRADISGMVVEALVEVGSSSTQQVAGEWAVREVLGDAVAVSARRQAVGLEGGERRNSIEEMRRHQQEMEDRARRQQQLAADGGSVQGPGDTARFLHTCVQPVLAKSLLAYDQEDPRPEERAAALKRAIRNPEEEPAPGPPDG
jgi:hypothetical protein